MLSALGPAEQLHGGSREISASSFWILFIALEQLEIGREEGDFLEVLSCLAEVCALGDICEGVSIGGAGGVGRVF